MENCARHLALSWWILILRTDIIDSSHSRVRGNDVIAGSYNKIILVGNLTRDPEIRYVQSGSAVTKFALAVNRRTKNGDDTTFVDIVAWDNGNYKLAETCNTYLEKVACLGVLVEGRSWRFAPVRNERRRKAQSH